MKEKNYNYKNFLHYFITTSHHFRKFGGTLLRCVLLTDRSANEMAENLQACWDQSLDPSFCMPIGHLDETSAHR